MKISFNARNDFATLAEAAGTSLEVLLKQATDNAVAEGTQASEDIDHDKEVIVHANLRIKRSEIVLKHATDVLKKVRKYVS
jgi:hypothetical protein